MLSHEDCQEVALRHHPPDATDIEKPPKNYSYTAAAAHTTHSECERGVEDDILREQIRLHGTENWAIIASKFKDKTTRQCRRRWFTYLNSDFKRGGWSPEEDMLLCEAQKIFGNRWTEIAKVVSGRTDNAVKNRFTTLCKKKGKERSLKPMSQVPRKISNKEKISRRVCVSDHLLRPPFAVLAQRVHSCEVNFHTQLHANNIKEASRDGSSRIAQLLQSKLTQRRRIRVLKMLDDKAITNLRYRHDDMLSPKSANPVCSDDNDSHLIKILSFGINMVQDHDVYESSPASSEYSSGSTLLSNAAEQLDPNSAAEENGICRTASTKRRALAATIPSPKFSESEKHFLMKTLGMEKLPEPNHQSLSTSTLQEVSSPLSMTILTHQPYMILCRVQESPRLSIRSFRG
ncbi:Transcription factor [Sesamum angolense]|uniref:Transcription factor n=1 Tax=Sesamum angolense TaxID=2727404 RepID=A0AAE1WUR2_9LAMI|nr:Transcription factor [Sesamum angolense]